MEPDEQREVYATIDLALRVGEVLLSSGPVDGKLPADTAVWIR